VSARSTPSSISHYLNPQSTIRQPQSAIPRAIPSPQLSTRHSRLLATLGRQFLPIRQEVRSSNSCRQQLVATVLESCLGEEEALSFREKKTLKSEELSEGKLEVKEDKERESQGLRFSS